MSLNIEKALEVIRPRLNISPKAAIILGSGLGPFADQLQNKIIIPTNQIPGYPASTVEGHHGNLVFGTHNGNAVLAVQGRTHYYEGYPIRDVSFVVRIIKALGVRLLIVTNAAGGINPRFKPGDLMLITDHVNFLFANPLRGSNEDQEPRFPDMSDAYSQKYFDQIEAIGLARGIQLKRGVLWASGGPTYETAAEVKMIQRFGGDAASMSTVPEVITAVQAGLQVIGISCITNMATGISAKKLSHEDVTKTAELVKDKFMKLVKGIIDEFTPTL